MNHIVTCILEVKQTWHLSSCASSVSSSTATTPVSPILKSWKSIIGSFSCLCLLFNDCLSLCCCDCSDFFSEWLYYTIRVFSSGKTNIVELEKHSSLFLRWVTCKKRNIFTQYLNVDVDVMFLQYNVYEMSLTRPREDIIVLSFLPLCY